ncbi:MAG: hypothetical protein R3Y24_07845 [Eubacteriales bacterium]
MTTETNKKKVNKHLIFFLVILFLFIVAIIRLFIWNKGVASGYDPNDITTEFDTEALDYIQPLTASQLEGHEDDGVTTILALGNSPFRENTYLIDALSESMDATIYNGSFANSFQSMKNSTYSSDYANDGVSLYEVVSAITSNDYTTVNEAASIMGGDAPATANMLQEIDFATIDMITIMYDLSDYIDLRPVYDPGDDTNLVTYSGALKASIQLIQKAYPYIRIVVMSMPSCGKTVDGFYVDGDIYDLGNGTLTDYLLYEIDACSSTGVSIIDLYYGVIHVDNRDNYLYDDYFINEDGAKLIAERFATVIY